MNKAELQKNLVYLGKEFALDILFFVNDNEWSTASEVAKGLELHVATAVKHLSELDEIDILEKRTRKGKTRSASEYKVKRKRITIDIDLDSISSNGGQGRESLEVAFRWVYEFIRKTGKFSGISERDLLHSWKIDLDEDYVGRALAVTFEKGVEFGLDDLIESTKGRDILPELTTLIHTIIRTGEKAYGEYSTRSLAKITTDTVLVRNEDEIIRRRLLDMLPEDY